eukprot:6620646-Pyramimonas_sp.AAC.1
MPSEPPKTCSSSGHPHQPIQQFYPGELPGSEKSGSIQWNTGLVCRYLEKEGRCRGVNMGRGGRGRRED